MGPSICGCGGGSHQANGGGQPSFSKLFELQRAVEELISAALRDGTAICPDLAAAALRARGAGLDVSAEELREAITSAARSAGLPIRSRG